MQTGAAPNLKVHNKSVRLIADALAILGGDGLESWLRTEVTWPEGAAIRGTRLNRLWPNKHGSLTFEIAVDVRVVDDVSTYMIQGGPLDQIKCGPPSCEAVLESGWVMNLSLSNSELGISLLSPDRDPRLAAVQDVPGRRAFGDLLRGTRAADFLGLQDEGRDLIGRVVAYRISKRCVTRLENPAALHKPSVFLKRFRRTPADEILQAYRCLGSSLQRRSDGRIGAPALLDHLPDDRVLLFEGADASAWRLTTNADDLCLAANVLALLHSVPITCSRFHKPQDEVEIAHRWLPILKALDGEQHEQFRAIVGSLEQSCGEISSAACCLVHRDFYAAQVLRQRENTWIVDLDTMSMGHPEVDIATFSAHLLLDEIVRGSTDDQAASLVRFFVDAYRNHGGKLSPDHLRFYLSSAIARLAAIHATRGLDRASVARLWRMTQRISSWL